MIFLKYYDSTIHLYTIHLNIKKLQPLTFFLFLNKNILFP